MEQLNCQWSDLCPILHWEFLLNVSAYCEFVENVTNKIQYNTISTIQYNTIQYNTILYEKIAQTDQRI